MRTITKVATAGVGMLTIGVLVAGPALAAEPGDGYGPGSTSQNGRHGPGRGGCLLDAPSGTLTATQRSTLQANAQEEKLREVVERAQKRSAVYDMVTNGVPVAVEVTTA